MLRTLLSILLTGSLVVAAGASKNGAPEDAKALQGEWWLTRLEAEGDKLDLPEGEEAKVVFKGDGIIAEGKKQFSFKLDLAADPKIIDLVRLDGDDKGEVLEGIYRLRGDTLTICLRGGDGPKMRPLEFATRPGAQCFLATLTRNPELPSAPRAN